jgi:hypothetical protein
MIRFADFPTFGINYTRQGIKNMIARGAFPSPERLCNGRLVWNAVAINTWLTSRGATFFAGHGASLPGATTHSRDMNRAEGDLRRMGLTLPATGTKLSIHAIDKAMADKGLSIQQRLVAKARLASLGVI